MTYGLTDHINIKVHREVTLPLTQRNLFTCIYELKLFSKYLCLCFSPLIKFQRMNENEDIRREIALLVVALGPLVCLAAALGPLACLAAALVPLTWLT